MIVIKNKMQMDQLHTDLLFGGKLLQMVLKKPFLYITSLEQEIKPTI